jgi:Uncharacterized conserved protein
MCCRYYMEMSPALRPIVEAANRSKLRENNLNRLAKKLTTEGEVRPDDLVPVIATGKSGGKKVFPMIWGYQVAGLDRPLINARTESAMEKKTFHDSWIEHRCIVPASWYFEWEHHTLPSGRKETGRKYAIIPKGQELTWLCGLYRLENNYPHFVILTRPPGEDIAFIHDRMPLILPQEAVNDWINPKYNASDLLNYALTDCVFEEWTERENEKLNKIPNIIKSELK